MLIYPGAQAPGFFIRLATDCTDGHELRRRHECGNVFYNKCQLGDAEFPFFHLSILK